MQITAIVFAQLCNSRSRYSLRFQHNMGLFLYSNLTSRLTIDFLSSCGLSSSYTTILRAIKVLSQSLLKKTSDIARGPHMFGFDNKQISMSQHVSQRPGTVPAVRSFTASVIYPLRNAAPEFCRLQPILERRRNSPIITYNKHILPSSSQRSSINQHLVIDILEILFKNIKKFDRSLYNELFQHQTHRPPPKGHKTEEFVCPTLEYDEAKTSELIRFLEDLYLNKLGLTDDIFSWLAIVSANDQLSNSRGRSALIERFGDLNAFLRMENFQFGISFFHNLMNLLWNLRCVHYGNSKNTGSLSNYVSFLGTKRIGNDRPDYFTLRSFANEVLAGNLLSLWKLKTGYEDLEEYGQTNPAPEDLKAIAQDILTNYTSNEGLAVCTGSHVDEADNVLHNAILMNRDLLLFYEHDSAISSGDFGRLELLLGTLTRMFNGSGAKNYSMELLHFIQNLNISWPPEFA